MLCYFKQDGFEYTSGNRHRNGTTGKNISSNNNIGTIWTTNTAYSGCDSAQLSAIVAAIVPFLACFV